MKITDSHALKRVGNIGERAAARFLKKAGLRILERNCHVGRNELDIVAADKGQILFVEVKTRLLENAESTDAIRPANAVDFGKRRRTLEAARQYLHLHPTNKAPRLDVIEVYLLKARRIKLLNINHIPDAFDARGNIR